MSLPTQIETTKLREFIHLLVQQAWSCKTFDEAPKIPHKKLPFAVIQIANLEPYWFTMVTKKVEFVIACTYSFSTDRNPTVIKDTYGELLRKPWVKNRQFAQFFEHPDHKGTFFDEDAEDEGESFSSVSVILTCEQEYIYRES